LISHLEHTSPYEGRRIAYRLRAYWTLVKSFQTGCLLVTGLAGYASAGGAAVSWQTALALIGSLFLTVAGSTVLSMVYDRDIDAKMERTRRRPLPSGTVEAREALLVGLVLATAGMIWALLMGWLYGLVVFVGLFFSAAVYTLWLKRRTPWSVVVGGIAGGMVVLSGRVLGTGQIDLIGVLLATAVLLWIPTHIVTFSIKRADDYEKAGIPVLPNTHGVRVARLIIVLSTTAAVTLMALAARLLELRLGYVYAVYGLSAVLLGITVLAMLRTSPRMTTIVYRLASLYMLSSMLMIVLGA
jgi:protoheme IX farnesyltransferase